ncbi:hypothetical protein PY310_18680 [Pseudarthrobacter sp. H3Y2-7]|uniref:hypothetical protein n=1 Tax=Pseudarthrobacter naphthalenicus TaxID=3031328 RepID=UPI0023B11206|nr:hypothetical protein [Pseudarthrobacter sp. H3Y2-7]MDE8670608.1 hypothetical protein [Pseudarthrobacter sp. H3Y2-7]
MTDDDQSFELATNSAEDPKEPVIGLMVIRTWHEPDHQHLFRARITTGLSPGGEQRSVAAANPDEVLMIVQEWLDGQSRGFGAQ